jgi:hypothetical protein
MVYIGHYTRRVEDFRVSDVNNDGSVDIVAVDLAGVSIISFLGNGNSQENYIDILSDTLE